MDPTDHLILRELSRNGRMTMKELGEKVHLTGQATAARVSKLEEAGIIDGYTIRVPKEKIGCPVHAFVTAIMNEPRHQKFLDHLDSRPDTVSRYFKTSGEGCYLIECHFPTHQELDGFLNDISEFASYKVAIAIQQYGQ
ncbi:Lrp/AsnC family transcriptional regulator [Planococcus sp. CP5-4]|nr:MULTISPECIES: Lrp/AsnC family transcriptional regulator [unclassified Planococcus (in: firmicutes)]MBU9673740.1 Lrp/AsnC family transcriptional regulator [Planococcus sp. CP5-4_YE]MBV0908030.1 Lrp/AsnC family transcriptional regulator [Planococcus sp. CP5-4_UN]MBW6063197.1 Lrp/AsnC family transcriptional regulator [Planococcus sp. CP5-4]